MSRPLALSIFYLHAADVPPPDLSHVVTAPNKKHRLGDI